MIAACITFCFVGPTIVVLCALRLSGAITRDEYSCPLPHPTEMDLYMRQLEAENG